MKYLLDTHAWVWMNSFPDLLSEASLNVLQELGANDALLLSPMIVATARLHDATIITRDRLIQDYPHVKTLW